MSKIVIDVSGYQDSSLSFFKTKKKQGASSAVVKLTEGTTYLNPKAGAQVANSLKVFGSVSVYHFFHGRGAAEAAYFLAWAKKFRLDKSTVLAIDVEATDLPWSTTSSVNGFLRYLISHGYKNVITYGSGSWFTSGRINRSQLVDKHIWVAAYNGVGPGVANANSWQFSDSWHGVDASYDFDGSLSGTKGTPISATKPAKAAYFKSNPGRIYTKTRINRYTDKAFKHKVDSLPKHTVIDVAEVVGYGKITRFKLANGYYITSNKMNVNNLYYTVSGGVKRVKSVKGSNRYRDLSLKHKVDHFPAGTKFDVAKVVKNGATTRLRLANGMYISGNKLINEFVK